MDYWMENAPHGTTGRYPHAMLDLGYANSPESRDRCDQIVAAGISRQNIQIVAYGRLLLRIPPRKLPGILKKFPGIEQRSTYSWCEYSWMPKGANDPSLAFSAGH